MKILVIDRMSADATKEKILPHRLDEARKVLEHFLSGKLREIYSRQDHARTMYSLLLFHENALLNSCELSLCTFPHDSGSRWNPHGGYTLDSRR